MDLYDELQAVLRSLDAAQVEYALCGAVALAIHGIPRATRDIDLLAQSHHLDALRSAVRSCGFTVEALPMTFAQSGITVHRFSKLGDAEPLMLDVLLAGKGLEAVWNTRIRLEYDGGPVWVVSRKGLVTLKLAAGRPQDLADIKRLEALDDDES